MCLCAMCLCTLYQLTWPAGLLAQNLRYIDCGGRLFDRYIDCGGRCVVCPRARAADSLARIYTYVHVNT